MSLPARTMRKTERDMTEGGIVGHLIRFSIPLIFGNLFQLLYTMVDTWVVGNYVSDEAFSAVGTVSPVTNLMIGFFMGLSGGAGVVISQFFGAKKYDRVKSAVHTSAAITLIMCVIFTALGLLMIPLFMKILDMPPEVETQAIDYLTIWFAGFSGLLIYNMGSGNMRAVGDSRRPFIFLIISAVLNIILDLLFVLSFNMGVKGVALATIISQGISALLVIISLVTTDSPIKISLKSIAIDIQIFKRILQIGIPTGLQMAITSFSNMFVQRYINHFGTEIMGGWSAYLKIDQIVVLPMQSVSIASTTFVGQNLGADQMERAKKGANWAFIITLISTSVLIAPIVIFADFFVAIFNSNPEVIGYGAMFLRYLTPFYLLWCVNQIYSGAIRGAGRSAVPMVIMLSSYVVCRQIYLFIISRVCYTIVPTIFCYPTGWLIAAICTVIYYLKVGLKPNAKKIKATKSET